MRLTSSSLRPAFQLTFHIAHFLLDQIDGEGLDRCSLSGFDVDDFQQSGQVLFARFQGVTPARAALDLIDHGLRPDGVINSPRAQAVSGGSVRYSERMSSMVNLYERSASSLLPHV
ncbi:hypothetical protein D3C80_1601400 [compost metagenome]